MTFIDVRPDRQPGLKALANRVAAPEPSSGEPAASATPVEESRARRQDIRRAAAQMIAERGVLKATMQGVGRAVKLRGSSLYHYYATREALFAEIMLEHLHALGLKVCAAFDATETAGPRQRLEAMIAAFLDAALAERNEHRLTLRSGDVLNEDKRHAVRVRTRSLVDLFGEVLALAVPDAAPAAVQVAAMSLVAAMSCAALWFHQDGEVAVADYARMLALMAMSGAAADPGAGIP
ncbi:MAG TPA: TetR/AcrR family transcriptional regulator [Acetobacteraceae bacterium]|nr:TetR/AcrR family transcriptional regulator [Acetobacteraceae bacterium]